VKERNARCAAIRKLIALRSIDSQERLMELLRQEGHAVTQATLSRDLKALGIGKIPKPDGGYTYTLAAPEIKTSGNASFVADFMRGFVAMEFSGAFALIRTLPGHASSVAAALDNMRVSQVLGTIAGDDTILVVPRDRVTRAGLLAGLRERLPEL
jgi:transcriptional regulator of arginine metabolism